MQRKFLIYSLSISLFIGASPAFSQEQSPERTCLTDYSIAQKLMPHELTSEQMDQLQAFADADQPAEGWKYLGELGDKYGKVSFAVISQDPEYKKDRKSVV